MRYLGVDFGQRRIGLALSDASGTLARPWQTVAAGPTPRRSAVIIDQAIADHLRVHDEAGLHGIVVGLPRKLNGQDTDQTAAVRQLADALACAGRCPVHLQDERLTSREAEARLARRERDWRRRKAQLDAAAAAIILQDFLDSRPGAAPLAEPDESFG
jgi:putative Holliday junction resolvase